MYVYYYFIVIIICQVPGMYVINYVIIIMYVYYYVIIIIICQAPGLYVRAYYMIIIIIICQVPEMRTRTYAQFFLIIDCFESRNAFVCVCMHVSAAAAAKCSHDNNKHTRLIINLHACCISSAFLHLEAQNLLLLFIQKNCS